MSFALLLALESIYLRLKSWYLAASEGNKTKRGIYLDKDPIEITREYKYLRIDFYSHRYFVPSSKRQRIAGTKALMDNLRKEAIVKATCWELKSHLCKALVLPNFTYGTDIWGGNLKNSHWKDLEKGMKTHLSYFKVCSSTTYHILLAEFERLHIELRTLKLL